MAEARGLDDDQLRAAEADLVASLGRLKLEQVVLEGRLHKIQKELGSRRVKGTHAASHPRPYADGDLVVITGGNGYRGRKAVLESCEKKGSEYWWLNVRKRRGEDQAPRILRKDTNFRLASGCGSPSKKKVGK